MAALDNSTLADRLAALFKCGQPVSENDAIALIGELLASWQTNGVPATILSGAEIIGQVAIDQTTPGVTNGVEVNAALPAGNNIIGNVKIDQTTPGVTNGIEINAAIPAGANAIGKLAANSGVDIGDVDVTSIAAGANTIGNTRDAGPAWTTSRGIGGARFTSADQSAAVASVTDAPTAGQKLVITDLLISSDTALRLDFSIESSATVIESVYMGANDSRQITLRGKWKLPTADKKLQVQSSVPGNISITPFYFSEA